MNIDKYDACKKCNLMNFQCECFDTHSAKTLNDEEIESCYQLWRSLSGDPAKLYQLFKLKEQEK